MSVVKKSSIGGLSLIVLVVLFIALVMVSNYLFRSVRLDLTEGELYTISEGTKNILGRIEDPINLYYFFSETTSKNIPRLRAYAQRVRELLEEYEQHANGKIELHIIDPVPYSEAEDRAAQFGLQGVPAGEADENIYFGLAGTNAVDDLNTIPFFQTSKESFLEYDITKMIAGLMFNEKTTVGLLSTLPLVAGIDPFTQEITRPWVVEQQMEQLFEVQVVDLEFDKIDNNIDVLMIVHPKNLSDRVQYAIDQYVLAGGSVIVFVDPFSESDPQFKDASRPPDEGGIQSSGLPRLFKNWGINFQQDKLLGDKRQALLVRANDSDKTFRHPALLGFDASTINQDDVITTGLDLLNMSTMGFLEITEPEGITTLVSSSNEATIFDETQFRNLQDPSKLLDGYQATGEVYPVVVRINKNNLKTAFPDGPPPPEYEDDEEEVDEARTDRHLSEASETANIIVVTDTDLLRDNLWVEVQDFFGQQVFQAWSDNANLVTNAIDNLAGTSDLISIRSRASFTRPFVKVEDLRRKADDQFRSKEQELQSQLKKTEQKIIELQSRSDEENALLLSLEQQNEFNRFQEQKLDIRKQLRNVRHQLDKDIEQLGTRLKIINIGLMPLVIAIFAVMLGIYRLRRQSSVSARSTS